MRSDATTASITRERDVAPDPSLAQYIGAHHSLQSAIADIVDNSFSAGASNIRIRFGLSGGVASSLQIIDDGPGMSAGQVDDAMIMGAPREYGPEELGHFGVGFKAASLSQADTLLVFSRQEGNPPVGRSMRHSSARGGLPRVSDFSTKYVQQRLEAIVLAVPFHHGTVIEWGDVRAFPKDPDAQAQDKWLDATLRNIAVGLGTRHHRLLGDGGPTVVVDTYDEDAGELGMEFPVEPLDPFVYSNDPTASYPKSFHASLPDAEFSFTAHVVPYADRTSPNYRLDMGGEEGRQGFFVYRRDRLLQVGGWNGVLVPSEDLRFARIRLDIDDVESHARINPEKSGVEFDPTLKIALHRAKAVDGTEFRDFQAAARQQDRASRSRTRRPLDFTPATGIPAEVRKVLEDRGHLREDADDFEIRWGRFPGRRFFDVDLDLRVLTINRRFRDLVGGSNLDDDRCAPLTRTMMFLLTADLFSGQYLGAAQKLRMEAVQEALWQAAEAEEKLRRGGARRR
ncbi:ATP-binding protein [Brachybacterium squillarum]|uniref:ATP-binding protein n=1 Tax=Brachybacterium squillarum TaxID=661979 RepID=UPI0022232A60|nr:ATP-binding protein [Brachybacterium squillarum]MCW1804353.1 ATP-binding protein [Brachybacterium squillarum]